jgi:hypothetical protein
MLQHDAVGLAIHKGQRRAAAPHVIAVARVIALIPVVALVHDGLTQRLHRGGCAHLLAEQRLRDHFRELAIAFIA